MRAQCWLTGLSASGKSTLAMALEQALVNRGYACYVLDGDNVRRALNANLGFSPEDRSENIRRVGEVAAFADAPGWSITAFLSPYRADRDRARQSCTRAFHEIHIAADLATCEGRDPKGLYKKARIGLIAGFSASARLTRYHWHPTLSSTRPGPLPNKAWNSCCAMLHHACRWTVRLATAPDVVSARQYQQPPASHKKTCRCCCVDTLQN